jgi:hypothetical protein
MHFSDNRSMVKGEEQDIEIGQRETGQDRANLVIFKQLT